MTGRAILDDGQLHTPILEVLAGKLTLKQVDATYRGARGLCPDCEAIRKQVDLSDGGSLALAIGTSDRAVTYRCGCYRGDVVERQMHFAHQKGYLLSNDAACHEGHRAVHREVVETIALHYRKDLGPGFTVDAECQFVRPGTPPTTYRPDIVAMTQEGDRHLCIEYQRSPEQFAHFRHRHLVRVEQWTSVIWFFDRRIWELPSTKVARTWLAERFQPFYRCWVDDCTGVLQVEAGTPAEQVRSCADSRYRDITIADPNQFKPPQCSIADIINAAEDLGWQRTRDGVLVREARPIITAGLQGLERAQQVQQQLYERVQATQAARAEEARQRAARAEEDRVRQPLLADIRRTHWQVQILGERADTEAVRDELVASWSVEQLQAELARLQLLVPEATQARQARQQELDAWDARLRRGALVEIQKLAPDTRADLTWSRSALEAELRRLRRLVSPGPITQRSRRRGSAEP